MTKSFVFIGTFFLVFLLCYIVTKIIFLIIDKKSNIFTSLYSLIRKSEKEKLFKILAFISIVVIAGIIGVLSGEINAYNLGIMSGILNSIDDVIFSRKN